MRRMAPEQIAETGRDLKTAALRLIGLPCYYGVPLVDWHI